MSSFAHPYSTSKQGFSIDIAQLLLSSIGYHTLNTFIYNLQTKPYGTVTLAANNIKLYILEKQNYFICSLQINAYH